MKTRDFKSLPNLLNETDDDGFMHNLKIWFSNILAKLNINKRISTKIYVITAVIFILFLTAMYITINLGYGNYYKVQKANTCRDYVVSFCDAFNTITNDRQKTIDEKRIEFIRDFENTYSLRVVIFDENMNLKYDGPIKYTGEVDIVTSQIVSNEAKIALGIYNDPDINKAFKRHVSGYSGSAKAAVPLYDGGVLYGFSKDWASDDGVTLSSYYAFLISSMQPIDDAVSSIKSFFVYFYIASIFVVLIVCIILSTIISKPLRRINGVAVKMSSFDFSEKCDDKYKDEIGSLAKSLNLLSSNLQRSLKKLKETNKKLEDDIERERNLEKIRKEFVAAVSHDLKTPVSIIQGYAEGIKDGIFEGEEAEYYLDVIIDETDKMNTLIKDMLDLSALEGGNINIKKEDYDISEQLLKSIKKLATMSKERGMRLAAKIPEGIYVNADYNRIEQVINNLITNAIKYGYENTDIQIRLYEDEEDYVNIEVENEGDLISKEDFEKIWTRFYKIDKSRNRSAGGTGLGLAISKNIIQLHNGEIGGYNKDNTIVFYFRLKNE